MNTDHILPDKCTEKKILKSPICSAYSISENLTYLPQKPDRFLEFARAAAFFSTKRTMT